MTVAALFTLVPVKRVGPTLFDPNPRPHSVVVDWVDAMLIAIEQNPPAPTATTWRMWVVVSSMYDAWSAYEPTAIPTVGDGRFKAAAQGHRPGSESVAVSYAAHRALTFVYPAQQELFDAVLDSAGLDANNSTDARTPAGIGNLSAQEVINARLTDGSNAAGGFAPITSNQNPVEYAAVNSADPSASNALGGSDYDPNRWTPLRVPTGTIVDDTNTPVADPDDPASYRDQEFLTPHWGAVDGFALISGDQFRPPAPPQLGSGAAYTDAVGNTTTHDAAFRDQTAGVLAASADLTDEHKVIAEFWADGPHTWTPPGHWVQLAIGVSLRDHHTMADDVDMFMTLTGALLDGGIAAWDAKRAYDSVRPASAIPHLYADQHVMAWGGPGRGRRLIDGSDWQPYQSASFVTPPFAEYISGHSTFSRAAAEVLTAFTGSPTMYDGTTKLGRDYDGDGHEDLLGNHVASPGSLQFENGPSTPIVLRWNTFRDAADEAGVSRRYGGIHFADGDLYGRRVGLAVGRQAFEHARFLTDPVSEIRHTLSDLHDQRELTWREFRVLTLIANATDRAFHRRQPAVGCRLVELLDAVTSPDRRDNRSAHMSTHLGPQIDLVKSALCAPSKTPPARSGHRPSSHDPTSRRPHPNADCRIEFGEVITVSAAVGSMLCDV